MLDKLECELVERRIGAREFHRDLSHVLAIQRHPGGAIRLFKVPAAGKGIAAIEDPNVVKAEEPSFKDILPKTVFPVDPPGEIEDQLVEDPLQKLDVTNAVLRLFQVVHEQGGPGMHWRVDVAKVPFVGWHLAARMQVE